MADLITTLLAKYPAIVSVLSGIGAFRLVFKPLMTAVDSYEASTPSTKDDAAVKKVEDSKVYKAAMWLMDYVFSIKLPEKK